MSRWSPRSMAFSAFGISTIVFILSKIYMKMSSSRGDNSLSEDSELWLFFDPAQNGEKYPDDLRLLEISSDSASVIRPMCVLKSASGSSEQWNPEVDLNQDAEGVVAVGFRIEGGGKITTTERVTWTAILTSRDSEKVRYSFTTHSMVDEGFVNSPETTDEGEMQNLRFRFLLIHDCRADPLPSTAQKTWLHSLPAGQVLMAGHRGLGSEPATERENSLAAFVTAHRIGADLVELDVQLTEDGRLCIHHDLSLPSSEDNKSSLVRDLKWEEVKRRVPHVTDLHEVLEKVDPGLGIDVEVKYPNNMMNGDVESEEHYLSLMTNGEHGTGMTRRWSKNRLADAILRPLIPASAKRRLFLSTFQPDLALVLSRKLSSEVRRQLPVVFLTRGETHPMLGMPQQHADPRSRTVDSGVVWATIARLDGLAPFAASLLTLEKPEERFDRDRMAAVVWGNQLNSGEMLRQLRVAGWASVLIFDRIDALLSEARS